MARGKPPLIIECDTCPLRELHHFSPFTKGEEDFMRGFKSGEMTIEPHTQILEQGSNTPQLYTVLSGMGLRYKVLENGRRQVVNFVFPGDFIGLQAGIMGEMQYSVQSSTKMTLCLFERKSIWQLFQKEPERAYDVTWVASVEEFFLNDAITAIGQMSGEQRVCWGVLRFHARCAQLKMTDGDTCPFPFRQADLADALGLSPEYTSRVFSKLRKAGVCDISDGKIVILDRAECEARAVENHAVPSIRPLI